MVGRSLALEGIDGCGKSTQLVRLLDWLAREHPALEVLAVREPGATALGERVRELLLRGADMGPMAEMLLYMACRAELYETVVEPALRRGAFVLLDRSYYSTVAYQGAGLGLDQDRILELAGWVTRDRAPDRVVVLRLTPQEAQARRAHQVDAADRIEARDPHYFERVVAAYDALALHEPARFRVLDAKAEEGTVFAGLLEVVRGLL